MAAGAGGGVTGEHRVQVDEDRAGQMAGFESGPAGAAVEVPPDVGDHDLGAQEARQPVGRHERTGRRHRVSVGAGEAAT